MANLDLNKLERIETPYGNGYAYGGRIYSEEQWNNILKSYKRGGRTLAAQEEAAWNKEMGVDDASIMADEAAINATRDAKEQANANRYDASEIANPNKYADLQSKFGNPNDGRYDEGYAPSEAATPEEFYNSENANLILWNTEGKARREANPVSKNRHPSVAKGAFDETGDAEDAPTKKASTKKPLIEQQTTDYSNVTDDKDNGITPKNPNIKNPNYSNNLQSNLNANPDYSNQSTKWLNDTELERRTELNKKSRELDKLWESFKKSHPGVTSRHYYNPVVGGTAGLKMEEYMEDPIVVARNHQQQKDNPLPSYTWGSKRSSNSFSKPFNGPKY